MASLPNKPPSPTSPEQTLALPPKLDEVCRVDDFINVFKLQAIMNTLVRRIDAQQAHIEKLEDEIRNNNISNARFEAYAKSVDERVSRMENTIDRWSAAWSKIESAAAHMDSYHLQMNEVISNLAQKVDIADFAQLKYDVSEAFDLHRQELDTSKASSDSVHNLEDSQRRLLEEVVALQQLIACKVDRVEVPLLNVAGEKLKKLVEFTEQCGPRLTNLEDAVVTTSKIVAGKVDRAAIEERLEYLHEQMRERPEFKWLNAQVLDPLDCVQKDLSNVLQTQEDVERALEQVELLTQQFNELKAFSQTNIAGHEDLRARLEHVRTLIEQKPSLEAVDARLVERDQLIEQILTKNTQKMAADTKLQSAFIGDVRAQMLELAQQQQQLDRRVGVVMKFVDWFADVKLKGQVPDL